MNNISNSGVELRNSQLSLTCPSNTTMSTQSGSISTSVNSSNCQNRSNSNSNNSNSNSNGNSNGNSVNNGINGINGINGNERNNIMNSDTDAFGNNDVANVNAVSLPPRLQYKTNARSNIDNICISNSTLNSKNDGNGIMTSMPNTYSNGNILPDMTSVQNSVSNVISEPAIPSPVSFNDNRNNNAYGPSRGCSFGVVTAGSSNQRQITNRFDPIYVNDNQSRQSQSQSQHKVIHKWINPQSQNNVNVQQQIQQIQGTNVNTPLGHVQMGQSQRVLNHPAIRNTHSSGSNGTGSAVASGGESVHSGVHSHHSQNSQNSHESMILPMGEKQHGQLIRSHSNCYGYPNKFGDSVVSIVLDPSDLDTQNVRMKDGLSMQGIYQRGNQIGYDGTSAIANTISTPNLANTPNIMANSVGNTSLGTFGNTNNFGSLDNLNFDNFENMSVITNFTMDWNQFNNKQI